MTRSQAPASGSKSNLPPKAAPFSKFKVIFESALKRYQETTHQDLTADPLFSQLQACDTPGAILTILQDQVDQFIQSRSGDERLKDWLNPTISVLYAFSAALGGGVGLVFPAANAIFTGAGALLLAAKEVEDSQDVLIDVFERIGNFFRRLEIYADLPPTLAMTDMMVKIMVEVLDILGTATKEMKQSRAKKILKKVAGIRKLEDGLKKLDEMANEETRMASAQVLKVAHNISKNVQGVRAQVKDINKKVEMVKEKVQMVIDGGAQRTASNNENHSSSVPFSPTVKLRQYLRKWQSPCDPPTPAVDMPSPVGARVGAGVVEPAVRFNGYGKYWGLLCQSPHRVKYKDELYPTALHLFEALKFLEHRPDLADQIRFCDDVGTTSASFAEHTRRDWGNVALTTMDEVLYLKFQQHGMLRALLLGTHPAELIYVESGDKFWGDGAGDGMNELGNSLMRVRERFKVLNVTHDIDKKAGAVAPTVRFNGYGDHSGLLYLSPHTVFYEDELYPTALHLFEALKFLKHRPDLADKIRLCEHVEDVAAISAPFANHTRRDWGDVALAMMDEVLYLKFRQHGELRALLLGTYPAELIYVESGDAFWGDGAGDGMNELGNSLMRVRERFHAEGGSKDIVGVYDNGAEAAEHNASQPPSKGKGKKSKGNGENLKGKGKKVTGNGEKVKGKSKKSKG